MAMARLCPAPARPSSRREGILMQTDGSLPLRGTSPRGSSERLTATAPTAAAPPLGAQSTVNVSRNQAVASSSSQAAFHQTQRAPSVSIASTPVPHWVVVVHACGSAQAESS